MGRKVKDRAFEESGEAQRLPSNTDVNKHTDRILMLRKKLKETSAEMRAEIKGEYDAASNAGIDRKNLKRAVKIIEDSVSDEDKMLTNFYLEKSGQFAFFATGDTSEFASHEAA